MAESIEMPASSVKKNIFVKNPRKLSILLFLLVLCILAGCICWLSLGKVKSVVARVDGTVYTVGPQIQSTLKALYAYSGEKVSQGQELASLTMGNVADKSNSAQESTSLEHAQSAEKQMAERLVMAQREEERLRQLVEESVMQHVRAQLALRAIHAKNSPAYEQAAANEKMARENMELAREQFNNANKVRAATERELRRIRASSKYAANYGANKNTTSTPAPKFDGVLVSPIDGKIIGVGATEGQTLRKGQTVFLIVPAGKDLGNNTFWIQAWFPPDAKDALAHGQPATITFPSGLELNGQINEIFKAQPLPDSYISTLSDDDPLKKDAKKIFLPCQIVLEKATDIPLDKLEPGIAVQCEVFTRSLLGFKGW